MVPRNQGLRQPLQTALKSRFFGEVYPEQSRRTQNDTGGGVVLCSETKGSIQPSFRIILVRSKNFPDRILFLQSSEADVLDWIKASNRDLLSALNEPVPFPDSKFLGWVKENKPRLWEAAQFSREVLGE